jgi:uncharacterized protein (TIGR02145 family)
MKRFLCSSIFIFLITALFGSQADLFASKKTEDLSGFQHSKTGFTQNKGQVIDQNNKPNPAVLYLLNTPGMNVQLRSAGWSYDVYEGRESRIENRGSRIQDPASSIQHRASSIQFHRIDIDLLNANPHPAIETSAPSSDYVNYYTPGTPADGITAVRSYSSVTYKNIYPGIDLQFISGNERPFEYNFILQPGADIHLIQLKVCGPEKIKAYKEGIRCETSLGEIEETIPVCYYSMKDFKVPVKGKFKKIAEHLYGFSVDQAIPSGAFLVIDPIPRRIWATYYGGSGYDLCYVTVSTDGNIILSGQTSSTNNIATAGSFQSTYGGGSANLFMAKLTPSGLRLWGTYWGDLGSPVGRVCKTDNLGNIYISGSTDSLSTNLASPGAYQTSVAGASDCFVGKFNSSGFRVWSTYYGGQKYEDTGICSVDNNGNVYLSGETNSIDGIATAGSHQPAFGGAVDAFLVKFNSLGQRLWGTYYGGSLWDGGFYCDADANGHVILSGEANSTNNIATTGSFQPVLGNPTTYGLGDGFLVLFDGSGQRQWGTYYGGTDWENALMCKIGPDQNLYISGETRSPNAIASPNGFQQVIGGSMDDFVAKFNLSGARIWGTYYGGTMYDERGSLAVDDSSNVFLCGSTNSAANIATPGSFQAVEMGSFDLFLVKFDSACHRMWGTYYGDTTNDGCTNCAVTGDTIYLAAAAPNSYRLTTPGSYQPLFGGGSYDGLLVKFVDCNAPDTANHITGNDTFCIPQTWVTYSIPPMLNATSYLWEFPPGATITSGQGTLSVTVDFGINAASGYATVKGINACGAGEPNRLYLHLFPLPVPVITGNLNPLQGSNETYSTQTGKTNYQWTFSSGGMLVSGGGAYDPTITLHWNAGGAQWVRVNYTDANGCTASTATQLDITVTTPLTVDFTAPDTVCVGAPVTITNLTQGGTSFYWNFCSGNANNNPTGINIGNPGGLLSIPTYITLVKQNDSCFSFISCQGAGVIRYYHGSSFANNPVSWTNLGKFGLMHDDEEGIQVKFDNGNWYGFVNDSVTVIRLEFGNSLANTPTATNLGPFLSEKFAHGLVVTQVGAGWVGFITDSQGASLHRLTFGSSLANMPTFTDFGNVGGAIPGPSGICLVQENSLWYAMVMAGNNTLARLTFGNSLMNTPSGVNLGNPGGFNNAIGLTFLRDCETTTGYWINYLVNGELGKLTFPTGILGSVTGTVLGNIGGLARPHSFSEIFRQNDTLFAYITNRNNGTLTRLTFPPCDNASVPSSNQFNPPPFSYNQPGTFNIHLIVDEGLPTTESLCKPIVVINPPAVNLGPDQSLCPGNTVTLNAGPGNSSYLWSTGATTQTIIVNAAGTYWAEVTKNGCTARDTVVVFLYTVNPVNLGADTTVCQGVTRTFDAGPCPGCTYQWGNITSGQPNIGSGQTYTTGIAGKYMLTITDTHGCLSRDTVQLFVTPVDTVKITIVASENPFCAGHPVTFTATGTNGGTTPWYQWKVNGANFGINNTSFTYYPANNDLVSCHLTSYESCVTSNPALSNSILMIEVSNLPASVSIAPSSNPFCPGSSITFTATPGNGGIPSYVWKVNGNTVGTNSNTYTYNPANGDSVRCIMTSNLSCVTGNPASSATIIMLGTLAPIVSFTACFDTITRINAKPVKLKGGIPLGGTYSGPGVNSITGIFTPALAGAGTHTITYSYTNAALCSATKSISIFNLPSSIPPCGDPITDPRDNKVYPTVQIGSQCWLATNLNFGAILASSQDQRDNCVAEKYCYNDNPVNCTNLGGLYQWDEVMRFDETPADQGFCPPGWHIPDENEWTLLFSNYINNAFAGSPLKYSGYSGFSALLSGERHINKSWDLKGFATFFWSSTTFGSTKAWAHGMNEADPSVSIYPSSRVNAFSVRCLRD